MNRAPAGQTSKPAGAIYPRRTVAELTRRSGPSQRLGRRPEPTPIKTIALAFAAGAALASAGITLGALLVRL